MPLIFSIQSCVVKSLNKCHFRGFEEWALIRGGFNRGITACVSIQESLLCFCGIPCGPMLRRVIAITMVQVSSQPRELHWPQFCNHPKPSQPKSCLIGKLGRGDWEKPSSNRKFIRRKCSLLSCEKKVQKKEKYFPRTNILTKSASPGGINSTLKKQLSYLNTHTSVY